MHLPFSSIGGAKNWDDKRLGLNNSERDYYACNMTYFWRCVCLYANKHKYDFIYTCH